MFMSWGTRRHPRWKDLGNRSNKLSAPVCPECNVEMAWSRSALVAAGQVVAHVFSCLRCDRIGETKTPTKTPKE